MRHDKTIEHADELTLRLLVFGEEESAEYRRVAEHVQMCDACRQRLEELVGSAEIEPRLSACLGDTSGLIDLVTPADDHSNHPAPRGRSYDFLAPPSHPEMLGRLGRYETERLSAPSGWGLSSRRTTPN